MKAFIVMLLGAASLAQAQEFIVAPSRPTERSVIVESVSPRPSIEGIVKEIFVTKKPWQMVNPAAPAHYGTGEKNVSQDFGGGTPFKSTGVVVVGVEW